MVEVNLQTLLQKEVKMGILLGTQKDTRQEYCAVLVISLPVMKGETTLFVSGEVVVWEEDFLDGKKTNYLRSLSKALSLLCPARRCNKIM